MTRLPWWLFGTACKAGAVAWWARREVGEAKRRLDPPADPVGRRGR
jgi:hypothetical protein